MLATAKTTFLPDLNNKVEYERIDGNKDGSQAEKNNRTAALIAAYSLIYSISL